MHQPDVTGHKFAHNGLSRGQHISTPTHKHSIPLSQRSPLSSFGHTLLCLEGELWRLIQIVNLARLRNNWELFKHALGVSVKVFPETTGTWVSKLMEKTCPGCGGTIPQDRSQDGTTQEEEARSTGTLCVCFLAAVMWADFLRHVRLPCFCITKDLKAKVMSQPWNQIFKTTNQNKHSLF